LLPATETGQVVGSGATTENPYFEVNAALMSRSTLWRLHPLSGEDLEVLVRRGVALRESSITDEALEAITAASDGDARVALTTLDTAIVLARSGDAPSDVVDLAHVAQARDGRLYHQSRDTHFDQISAFIKSVRGSDPDGALYWLVTMLESGESPRFLARRLVILASEDIGLADPMGLVLADAAARTVEFIGLPEGRLTLAHATITLALMPKSNSVTRALGAVTRAVQEGGVVEVPDHLRGSNYRGASEQGFGTEYEYPHDYERGWVAQQYLPDALVGEHFYDPSEYGREKALVEQWRVMVRREDEANSGSPVE
jgi:putative ATPase